MKNFWEWMRILTPIMIFIVGIYVHEIDQNILSLTNTAEGINDKMFKHLTNDEMHTPRSIVVTKAEFSIYQQFRSKQMDDLSDGISDIKNILINKNR